MVARQVRRRSKRHLAYKHEMTGLHFRTRFVTFVRSTSIGRRKPCALIEKVEHHRRVFNARDIRTEDCDLRAARGCSSRCTRRETCPDSEGTRSVRQSCIPSTEPTPSIPTKSTGLDFKACTWLRDFRPIFPKIAVRQTVGGHGAAEGNSKPCNRPTQYASGSRIYISIINFLCIFHRFNSRDKWCSRTDSGGAGCDNAS